VPTGGDQTLSGHRTSRLARPRRRLDNTAKYNYNDTTKVITSILDGRNLSTSNQFNAHGDLLKNINPLNDATTYDVATSTYNLTKITSPTGGIGGTGAAGRTMQYVFPTPAGNGATADYRPTSAIDAQGNTTAVTYNTWGQTATAAVGTPAGGGSPAGGTWSYQYQGGSGATAATCGGKPGQLCSVTDGKGNVTGYAYDAAGNLSTMTPPAGLGAHTFTYDAAGRKVSEVDGKGTTTYTCYDGNDRVLQVSTSSSNCAVASGITYTYDAAGNTITRKNATSTATIAYDAQNRPTSKTETASTVYNSSVTYDRASNVLTSVSGGAGAANTTTYTYDAANNLASLAMPGGSCPSSTSCVTFGYDDAERRNLVTFPSGAKTATTYDTSGRPLSIKTTNSSGATLVSRAYTYTTTTGLAADTALVGTVTDQTGNVTTHGYDAANRLTGATVKNSGGTVTGSQTFTYDLNGNRTQQVITGTTLGAAGTTNYQYNAADQLCWSGTGTSATCTPPAGATTYTYDGQGNQTSGGNTYNSFDQLTGTTTGGTLTHTYAGTTNNERFSFTGTTFTNSLLNQVTQETSSAGTTRYVRDPHGTLIGMQDNTGVNYYYTLDNVGSAIMLIDGSQTAAATYTYDPYGNTLTNTGTSGINTTNHYRYATGYTDPTGLTKLGARYYNPTTGRFTQTDPSGQETNRYAYVNGNPIAQDDSTGLSWLSGLVGYVATIAVTVTCEATITAATGGVASIPASYGCGLAGTAAGVWVSDQASANGY
jgi:RHS repeat-associated protein